MLFLGNTFCGGLHNIQIAPSAIRQITEIELKNCILDGLYVTKNTEEPLTASFPPVKDWNFDTLINAPMDGNLIGGNIDFTADQISAIRIKRAEENSNDWITLFEIPIHENSDMDFSRIDRTANGNTRYKYAFVALWNENMEGNYNINTVKSEFEGIWLVDKEMSIHAFLNLGLSTERHFTTSSVVTMGRKYPFVNKYGLADYVTGEIDATFLSFHRNTCDFDMEHGTAYRELIESRLVDGRPLLIKHFDGRSWIAAITDSIPKDERDAYQLPRQTICFTQVGDSSSSADLYDNHIIDCDVERGSGG